MFWIKFDRWGFFPEVVNEYAARFLASGVALGALLGILFGWLWVAPLLAVGFCLRVWAGSRFDPMAKAAVWLAGSIVGAKDVPGVPKRFAQLLGATLTLAASGALLLGADKITFAALLLLLLLASLEALGGVCLGCKIFSAMIGFGWVPENICRRCQEWRPSR